MLDLGVQLVDGKFLLQIRSSEYQVGHPQGSLFYVESFWTWIQLSSPVRPQWCLGEYL